MEADLPTTMHTTAVGSVGGDDGHHKGDDDSIHGDSINTSTTEAHQHPDHSSLPDGEGSSTVQKKATNQLEDQERGVCVLNKESGELDLSGLQAAEAAEATLLEEKHVLFSQETTPTRSKGVGSAASPPTQGETAGVAALHMENEMLQMEGQLHAFEDALENKLAVSAQTNVAAIATAATQGRVLPMAPLRRDMHVSMFLQPGATAVYPIGAPMTDDNADDDEESATIRSNNYHTVDAENDIDPAPEAPELLLSATLVLDRFDEDQNHLQLLDELVEASPAPEGFHAILENKRFQPMVACMCLLLIISIATPLAVVLPGSSPGPVPPTECGTSSVLQVDYRGTQFSVTASGRTCQRWDSQSPFSHDFYPNSTLYSSSGLEENYCRNPNGEVQAWCFTTDPSFRFEYCSVPNCETGNAFISNNTCGTNSQLQEDYRGSISVTKTGKKCQLWASQFPHRHENKPELQALAGLENNYCRNPPDSGERKAAWCYTTDPSTREEYCDVPFCDELETAVGSSENLTCKNCTTECGSDELNQRDYQGTINITETGRTCQRWDSFEPHRHQHNQLEANFCRNPVNLERAGCFTTDPDQRYELCNVPFCATNSSVAPVKSNPEVVLPDLIVEATQEGIVVPEQLLVSINKTCGTLAVRQTDYRGGANVTASGHACQSWSSQEPHSHKFTPEERPLEALDENYCRNPDGVNLGAWCYVSGPNLRWEYCNVASCEDKSTESSGMIMSETCGSIEYKQKDYRGTANATKSGEPCQAWSSQSPHAHMFTPESRASDNLERNYCRNPDGSGMAWCYTSNPDILWGACDVPVCEEAVGGG